MLFCILGYSPVQGDTFRWVARGIIRTPENTGQDAGTLRPDEGLCYKVEGHRGLPERQVRVHIAVLAHQHDGFMRPVESCMRDDELERGKGLGYLIKQQRVLVL